MLHLILQIALIQQSRKILEHSTFIRIAISSFRNYQSGGHQVIEILTEKKTMKSSSKNNNVFK